MTKKEAQFLKTEKSLEKLQNLYKKNQTYLTDTLNVKLRYEQIIKNLISNEEADFRASVVEIIATT